MPKDTKTISLAPELHMKLKALAVSMGTSIGHVILLFVQEHQAKLEAMAQQGVSERFSTKLQPERRHALIEALNRSRSARVTLTKAMSHDTPADLRDACREIMRATMDVQDIVEDLGISINSEHVFTMADRFPAKDKSQ